jgi:hypothetical protein
MINYICIVKYLSLLSFVCFPPLLYHLNLLIPFPSLSFIGIAEYERTGIKLWFPIHTPLLSFRPTYSRAVLFLKKTAIFSALNE